MTNPTHIVVIGESLIDVVITDDSTTEYTGGSLFNVAVGLGKLGDSVQLVTAIGDDSRGIRIANALDNAGVTLFAGSISAAATSTSTATLNAEKSASYTFAIEWSLDFVAELPPAAIVHTGSIAAFLEPGASTLERLLAEVPPSTIISFDPNIRPSIIDSRENSAAIVARLAPLCTVFKLSDEDGFWLYGTSAGETLEIVLGLGASAAIVTLGDNGALLGSHDARVHVPGVTATLVDTIGAGDSFMAAFLHGIARMLDSGTAAETLTDGSAFTHAVLENLGCFATHCAAITVSRSGANPPTLAEVL